MCIRDSIISSVFSFGSAKESEARFSDKTVNELIKAVFEMAKVKTGALIVIEKKTPLNEYERTGITLDSVITSQLLINIFEKNTPLHDGAVIIREMCIRDRRQCDASTLRNGNTAIQKKEAPLLEASFKLFSIWSCFIRISNSAL